MLDHARCLASKPVSMRQLALQCLSQCRIQRGVVRVADGTAPVQKVAFQCCQWRIEAQSVDQVRVADEAFAEGDHVGRTAGYRLDRHCTRVPIVNDPSTEFIATLETAAQRSVVERRHVARTAGGTFDHMNKRKLQRRELFDEVAEQVSGIAVLFDKV